MPDDRKPHEVTKDELLADIRDVVFEGGARELETALSMVASRYNATVGQVLEVCSRAAMREAFEAADDERLKEDGGLVLWASW